MLAVSRAIDAVNTRIGRITAWLILVAVLVSAVNAVVRKTMDMSSNAWLELQTFLFGAVFLFCASWTLQNNEHIRIDILNNAMPNWLRHTIELVGHALFLIPVTIVMIITAWPFFYGSYLQNEQSFNAGGLPQWPAKALIFVGFVLLFLQGVSELIKRLAIISGQIAETPSQGGHHAAAEAEAERIVAVAKAEADARLGIVRAEAAEPR